VNRRHANALYTTSVAHDNQGGWIAIELRRKREAEYHLVARVVFWDATGQFYLETLGTDVELAIIEELIAEARATIKVR
jgi:hypothetical protein